MMFRLIKRLRRKKAPFSLKKPLKKRRRWRKLHFIGYPAATGLGFFYGAKSVIEVQNYNPQIDKLNRSMKRFNNDRIRGY